MEAINDSAKLIAQVIDILNSYPMEEEKDEPITKSIKLLKTALDKLTAEI